MQSLIKKRIIGVGVSVVLFIITYILFENGITKWDNLVKPIYVLNVNITQPLCLLCLVNFIITMIFSGFDTFVWMCKIPITLGHYLAALASIFGGIFGTALCLAMIVTGFVVAFVLIVFVGVFIPIYSVIALIRTKIQMQEQ